MPYLSTPILTAYLKAHGVHVVQRDLNVAFWRHLNEPASVRQVYAKVQEKWEELSQRQDMSQGEERLQILLAGVKALGVEQFLTEVRDGVIDRDSYRQILQAANGFAGSGRPAHATQDCEDQTGDYSDPLFWCVSLSRYASSSQRLARIVSDKKTNPFFEFFRRSLASEISGLRPGVLGISIVAANQVVPAFTLARVVKDLCPETHVVIGGSWCTLTRRQLAPVLAAFDCIDSMIAFEGEVPLLALCRTLQENGDLGTVPNLYFKRGGAAVFSGRTDRAVEMDDLPPPSFEGLPLGEYEELQSLPIQASRGCYWGKCTFCSYRVLEPQYKLRSVRRVVTDLLKMKSRYAAASLMLADAAVSPKYAGQLAEALLGRSVAVEWVAFARLDPAFTPALLSLIARSGCRQISWGLESANDRVLQVIKKSVSIENAERILRASASAGIHNRLLVMYGHPTERYGEALDTVAFVKRNWEHVHSLSCNYYHPERGTEIEELARQYSLTLEADPHSDLSLGYLWQSQLSRSEKELIGDHYRRLGERIRLRRENCEHDPSGLVEMLTSDRNGTLSVQLPGRAHKTKAVSYLSRDASRPRARRRFAEVIEV